MGKKAGLTPIKPKGFRGRKGREEGRKGRKTFSLSTHVILAPKGEELLTAKVGSMFYSLSARPFEGEVGR